MVQSSLLRFAVVVALACSCAGSTNKPAAKPATCACKSHAASEPDEPALMAKAKADLDGVPAAALAATDAGERRFGDSAFAEERRALAIQALINLGEIGAARSRAYKFMERYPNGPYSAHIASMTGVHVTPLGPAEQKQNP